MLTVFPLFLGFSSCLYHLDGFANSHLLYRAFYRLAQRQLWTGDSALFSDTISAHISRDDPYQVLSSLALISIIYNVPCFLPLLGNNQV